MDPYCFVCLVTPARVQKADTLIQGYAICVGHLTLVRSGVLMGNSIERVLTDLLMEQ